MNSSNSSKQTTINNQPNNNKAGGKSPKRRTSPRISNKHLAPPPLPHRPNRTRQHHSHSDNHSSTSSRPQHRHNHLSNKHIHPDVPTDISISSPPQPLPETAAARVTKKMSKNHVRRYSLPNIPIVNRIQEQVENTRRRISDIVDTLLYEPLEDRSDEGHESDSSCKSGDSSTPLI